MPASRAMVMRELGPVTWYRTRVDDVTTLILAQGSLPQRWWTVQIMRAVRADAVTYHATVHIHAFWWAARWTPPDVVHAQTHTTLASAKGWATNLLGDLL